MRAFSIASWRSMSAPSRSAPRPSSGVGGSGSGGGSEAGLRGAGRRPPGRASGPARRIAASRRCAIAAGWRPGRAPRSARGARAGRPPARRPGGRRGRGRASAARGSARGTGARRSAPRARRRPRAWRPSARSSSIALLERVERAARRAGRPRPPAGPSSGASASGGPRNSASASRSSSAASCRRGAAGLRDERLEALRGRARRGRAGSRSPTGRVTIVSGAERRRSWETWTCSALSRSAAGPRPTGRRSGARRDGVVAVRSSTEQSASSARCFGAPDLDSHRPADPEHARIASRATRLDPPSDPRDVVSGPAPGMVTEVAGTRTARTPWSGPSRYTPSRMRRISRADGWPLGPIAWANC